MEIICLKLLIWVGINILFIYLLHELYLLSMWITHYFIRNNSAAFIGDYNIFVSEFKKGEPYIMGVENTFYSEKRKYINVYDITEHEDRLYYIDLLYFKFNDVYMVLHYNDYCKAMNVIKKRYKERCKRRKWLIDYEKENK